MDQLLALDIAESYVAGLLLDTAGKAAVVSRYSYADTRDRALDEAIGELKAQLGDRFGSSIVSIRSGAVTYRNLELPFQERQKIEKVLPLELEELTARSGRDIHYDFILAKSTTGSSAILAAMLERDKAAQILAALQGQGIDPELITVSGLPAADDIATMNDGEPSFILVDAGGNKATLFFVADRQVVLIRPLTISGESSLQESAVEVVADQPALREDAVEQLGLEIKRTLIAFRHPSLSEERIPVYLSGSAGLDPHFVETLQQAIELPVMVYNAVEQPLLKIDPVEGLNWDPGRMNNALALALRHKSARRWLNFRRGDFRKPQSLKQVGQIGILAGLCLAAILLGWSVYAYLDYSRLKNERDEVRTRIQEVFHETLPEVTRVVQPVQQLRVKIDEIRKLYSGGRQGETDLRKVDLLAELSARIPDELQIRFTRLVADENDVRLRGETADFNTVDNVQKELQKSDLFSSVEINSANLAPKGGGVRFELKLEMK